MQRSCEEISVLISGYIDGELDRESREKVEQHLAECAACQREAAQFRRMTEVADTMKFRDPPDEVWKTYWQGVYNRLERGTGWVIFAIGLAVLVAYGIYEFVTDPGVAALVKVLIAAPIVGLVVLFISVLREKMAVNRYDKYKDIQQ